MSCPRRAARSKAPVTAVARGLCPAALLLASLIGAPLGLASAGRLTPVTGGVVAGAQATPPPSPTGVAGATTAPFGPVCEQLQLKPGDLIQAEGEVDIVDRACLRRHVPNPPTLGAIQQSYQLAPVKPLAPADWQRLVVGPAIPDASADPTGFQQAMREIFWAACLYQSPPSPPPPPPPGAAVFSSGTDFLSPDLLVLYRSWDQSGCDPGGVSWLFMSLPATIAVAPGAAVVVRDDVHGLVSLWGAKNFTVPEAPATIPWFPDRPDLIYSWQTTGATVEDAPTFLAAHNSCRACSLPNVRFTPPPQLLHPTVAFEQDLSGADLKGAILSGDFSGWNLSGADLSGADLSGASLAGADLTGAVLDRTVVAGAVFDGSDLRGAQLRGLRHGAPPSFADVRVGPFNGACTVFQDTDLLGARLAPATVDPGCEASPLLLGSTAPLDLIKFVHNDAARIDFTGARFAADAAGRGALAGADLSGINLAGASFVGFPADFSGTHFDGASLQGTHFELAELAGATFTNVNAAGASFRGARLAAHGQVSGANFAGAQTDLEGADFIDADVSGASFSGADLSGAAFNGALAVETNFNGVRAVKAGFKGAHIYGNGEAFNQARDLNEIDFTDALLAGDATVGGGFNLTHADLTGAQFDDAQCIGCNFTGSVLEGAVFSGAYLPGAKLQDTTLSGTRLDNAWLYCGNQQDSACTTGAGAPPAAQRLPAPVGPACAQLALEPGDLIQAQGNAAIDLVDRGCRRRHVPNQPTLTLIEQTYHMALKPLAEPDLQRVPAGPAIPDAGTNPAGFQQAMQQIFGPSEPRATTTPSPAAGSLAWPLDLGAGEDYGPVPFATTDLTGVSLDDVAVCPDGNPPDPSTGCAGDAILPVGTLTLPVPCSAHPGQPDGRGAAGLGACPTQTTTLFDATSIGKPLAVAAAAPPTWATKLTARGYYVGLDDGTVRLVGEGDPQVFAGRPGEHCASPTAPCGDKGAATDAQLGVPGGLAVGLDGSLYVADPALHRVRRIDPSSEHTITTVAGSGQDCDAPTSACGDGGPAMAAALGGPQGVWVDPTGLLWIADGRRGLREVLPDGNITTVGGTPEAYDVQSVVGDGTGNLYAATTDPDYLLMIVPPVPPGPVCEQLALEPGALIQLGDVEIDIVAPGCQRRHVPNPPTLGTIQQTYRVAPVKPLAPSDWQRLVAGPAIPDASADPSGFQQAMWAIFGLACEQLQLKPGDLIQAQGGPEIDIVDRACLRRPVPNPPTLGAIQQTYHVAPKPLAPSDFQRLVAGPAIPDASADPTGFQQAMQQIFGTAVPRATPAPTPAPTGRAAAALGDGGQVTPVAGTGTPGYNGTDDYPVQVNHPQGLAVRLDGAVLFADTGNALVRLYRPDSGEVVDVGGLIKNGTPQVGFDGDDHWADQTELDQPQDVTATGEARLLFVVADTRNARVRLLGPKPSPTPTPTAGLATGTPTPTASPSPTPTATATPTATRSVSPSASSTPTPGRTPTPSPTRP
jgi:uncharacterized protein YjbI with pentapeptide repeats